MRSRVEIILVIGLGAIIGANLRYFLGLWFAQQLGRAFPWGTFFINIGGSSILGLFVAWVSRQSAMNPNWQLFIAVGFCGAFTTFSSFSVESLALIRTGDWPRALVYVLGTNLLCVLGAFIGFGLGNRI